MKIASKEYIISTVFKTNILPITSECNTACVFCSHKQNPEGIDIFRLPKMGLDEFKEIISFLSPEHKIIIGESATRIIEGEPLLHKEFIDILGYIRGKYRYTTIQITTNGTLLNKELIDKLVDIGNIELNISVNCINPIKREQILGIKKNDNIKEKIFLLKGRLKFSGSCVYIPEVLDIKDIEEIAAILSEAEADNIRLFLPGYTYKAKKIYDLDFLYKEVHDFLMLLKPKYDIPIIIEPSIISDLNCRVEGIVKNTPAFIAGLKEGDLITRVNGENTCTRVETFNKVYRSANPVLTVNRDEVSVAIKIKKMKNSPPGFILLYDIDPGIIKQINDSLKRYNCNNALIITSGLAYNLLVELFKNSNLEFKYNIIAAKNRFFGGNIKCAGLLTIQDISDTVKEYIKENKMPDIIILPPIMFDNKKADLSGRNLKEIEDEFKIPIELI